LILVFFVFFSLFFFGSLVPFVCGPQMAKFFSKNPAWQRHLHHYSKRVLLLLLLIIMTNTAAFTSSGSRVFVSTSKTVASSKRTIVRSSLQQQHKQQQQQKSSSSVALSSSTFQHSSSSSSSKRALSSKTGPNVVVRAEGGDGQEAAPATAAPAASPKTQVPESYIKLLSFSDLPRGDRKKIDALGKSILLFWYRDTICAIESRSPSEGAYSEGFERARLTQDACIECPTTKTTFDLKTGEIKAWYPDNPVLAKLTPQETCRNMEVFPVVVAEEEDAIYVGVKDGSLGPGFVSQSFKGGSDTSLENNNVFGIEPRMYTEDGQVLEDASSSGSAKLDPGTVAVSIAGVAALAVGGTATCLYFENYVLLGIFWIAGFAAAAKVALDVTGVDISELTKGD
jgi:nitrite reductase/ring-hydroxylating ferredoxin subunit